MCERYMDQLLLAHPPLVTWPATQACALTGDQTGDLLVPRLLLNPLSHTNQGLLFYSGGAASSSSSFVPLKWGFSKDGPVPWNTVE